MLRRFTAALAMLALLGLIGVLVWEVYHHRLRPAPKAEPAIVVVFSLQPAAIA